MTMLSWTYIWIGNGDINSWSFISSVGERIVDLLSRRNDINGGAVLKADRHSVGDFVSMHFNLSKECFPDRVNGLARTFEGREDRTLDSLLSGSNGGFSGTCGQVNSTLSLIDSKINRVVSGCDCSIDCNISGFLSCSVSSVSLIDCLNSVIGNFVNSQSSGLSSNLSRVDGLISRRIECSCCHLGRLGNCILSLLRRFVDCRDRGSSRVFHSLSGFSS